jgi:hypothetical protein
MWEGVDWIHLAQDRDRWLALANTVMNLRVLQKAEKFLTGWVTNSFSRRNLVHWVSFFSYIFPFALFHYLFLSFFHCFLFIFFSLIIRDTWIKNKVQYLLGICFSRSVSSFTFYFCFSFLIHLFAYLLHFLLLSHEVLSIPQVMRQNSQEVERKNQNDYFISQQPSTVLQIQKTSCN